MVDNGGYFEEIMDEELFIKVYEFVVCELIFFQEFLKILNIIKKFRSVQSLVGYREIWGWWFLSFI